MVIKWSCCPPVSSRHSSSTQEFYFLLFSFPDFLFWGIAEALPFNGVVAFEPWFPCLLVVVKRWVIKPTPNEVARHSGPKCPLCSPPTPVPFFLKHEGLNEPWGLRNWPEGETGFLLKPWAVSGRQTELGEWANRGKVYSEVSSVLAIHLFLREGETRWMRAR